METEFSFPHLVPILRQINPVHNIPTDVLSILILSSHLRLRRSSSLFLSGFPHQIPGCTFPLLHTCHTPSPSNSSSSDHPHDICWWFQVMNLLTVLMPLAPCYLVPPPLWTHVKWDVSSLNSSWYVEGPKFVPRV